MLLKSLPLRPPQDLPGGEGWPRGKGVTSGRRGEGDEKLVKLVGPTDIFPKNPDFFAFSLQNQFFIAKIKFLDAKINFQ